MMAPVSDSDSISIDAQCHGPYQQKYSVGWWTEDLLKSEKIRKMSIIRYIVIYAVEMSFTKSFATSIGFTSLMSNLNLIVFDLFSMEHSTNEPCCTLNINNLGMRSDDLFERRTFVSLDAVLADVADAFCDDELSAVTLIAVDVVVCPLADSVGRFCSRPGMHSFFFK